MSNEQTTRHSVKALPMDDKTIVEREILKIIRKGNGEYGWYSIGVRFSNMNVPRIPGIMECLVDLEKRRFICEFSDEKSKRARYEITEAGISFLERLENESSN